MLNQNICRPPGEPVPINQFAVVCYIPEFIGDWITRLRQELVCGCTAQSHVTILPPRPLEVAPSSAQNDVRWRSAEFPAFELDFPRIRIFEQTSVVFAEIGKGRDELFAMHETLNQGSLHYNEPFDYHPHITLAQNFDPARLREVYDLAVEGWKELSERSVLIENLTFVQNTENHGWIDLAEFDLRAALAPSF